VYMSGQLYLNVTRDVALRALLKNNLQLGSWYKDKYEYTSTILNTTYSQFQVNTRYRNSQLSSCVAFVRELKAIVLDLLSDRDLCRPEIDKSMASRFWVVSAVGAAVLVRSRRRSLCHNRVDVGRSNGVELEDSEDSAGHSVL
jgi:hypothetical protein